MKWASRGKSAVTVWEHNVKPCWLYSLACEVAGKSSLTEDEIMPTLFTAEGYELLKSVVRSEYYFWLILHSFAVYVKELGQVPLMTLQNVISDIRASYSRIDIEWEDLRQHKILPVEASKYTAMGVILWNFETGDWEINPLWE